MEFDKDLSARQEVRQLCRQAEAAAAQLRRMSQSQLDAITEAIARQFSHSAAALAQQAAQETGFGNTSDKEIKNRFASETVLESIRNMKTVGILSEKPQEKLWEIGVPVGVIAAIVPSTNPTSTICYKALIALKSGNAIVFSPHPKALRCSLAAARIVAQAAESAGAPKGSISCLQYGAMAGTEELMHAPQVRLILATGGPGMVKAAYSSGKPAIGVGAGNGPAYIHRSADIRHALSCILRSKTFDFGTVCASEQSIILEKELLSTVLEIAKPMGFYFMSNEEAKKLSQFLFRPSGALNPDVVGKPVQQLAQLAGFSLPDSAKVLVAPCNGVGPKFPYSMEKLCPVLALFVEADEAGVKQRSLEILSHEGSGHTFSIHAEDEAVIRRFALEIPVSRFLVNTPAALGGIGQSTNLFPALTLGCGAVGGSSSANNISPLDLINIRRVAWDTASQPEIPADQADLVEQITAKLLQRLQ